MDFSSAMPADEAEAFLSQSGGSDSSAPELDEATGEQETSNVTDPAASTDAAENVWFDAKKVPAELQPTFRAMQASWTKKTQEAAESMRWHRQFTESYGDPAEVQAFLDNLRDPNGLREFVTTLAEQLGITRQEAAQVAEDAGLTNEPAQQTPQAPQGYLSPEQVQMMMDQRFMQWQQQMAEQQKVAQEDAEIEDLLGGLEIPEPLKDNAADYHYQVLAAANRLPAHLGYAERIKRAAAGIQSMFDSYASALSNKAAEVSSNTPAPLGGGMPSGHKDAQDPKKWPSKSDLMRELGLS